jgi:hypothetical protein
MCSHTTARSNQKDDSRAYTQTYYVDYLQRADKLWKAVKEGKAKTVADILKRPYRHTKPAVPLLQVPLSALVMRVSKRPCHNITGRSDCAHPFSTCVWLAKFHFHCHRKIAGQHM